MEKQIKIALAGNPNSGKTTLFNLYCLSSKFVESVDSYTKAISVYPYMGDAYFNRGLVLIYLKDKEKGCIDLSRAGSQFLIFTARRSDLQKVSKSTFSSV